MIMLCDTLSNEKVEVVRAAAIGWIRRGPGGDMRTIIEEVRRELDVHSYPDVKIFLSGRLLREDVVADAFGIGARSQPRR